MIGEVGRDSTSSDLPALARSELRALLAQLGGLDSAKVSEPTRIYLDDVRARISQALEPKAVVQSAPAAPAFRVIFGGDVDAPADDLP